MARRKPAKAAGPYLLYAELPADRVPAGAGFPYTLPAVRHLGKLRFHPRVTFLVGENGSGKSTLLEAVAVGCGLNPEGGSRNFRFDTRPSHSSLADALRLGRTAAAATADSWFLRAESYFNVGTEIERLDRDEPGLLSGPKIIGHYGGRSLHEQSHGESFLALFEHRLGGPGLYLLDEPEAALSPARQLRLLSLLHDRCRRGSQFVVATHSPILMAYPDAALYVLTADGPRQTAYTDTEHYRITREFLADPAGSLGPLLGGDP